jgi:replicative DNA helicase
MSLPKLKNASKVPYNLDAEESVIGSILIDTDSIRAIHNWLQASDFFSEQNQIAYQGCLNIYNRGEAIDEITLTQELIDMKKLDEVGGASYLVGLVAHTPTSLHIAHYGKVVQNLSLRRKFMSFGEQATSLGENNADVNDSCEKISKMFLGIQKGLAAPQLLTPGDIAQMAVTHYDEVGSGRRVAISCGIETLDQVSGGMFPGEYWIIGAATGLGKTALVINTIAHKLYNHFKILYVGLEMTPMQIMDRQLASFTKQPIAVIRRGNYSDNVGRQVADGIADFAGKNLYFYSLGTGTNPQSITTDSIFSVGSYMKMAYGLDLVIVDYLSLLDDRFGDSSYERVGYISRKLKLTATALGVPFIVVCQLNRELFTRNDPRPQISDLRDSGKLEQDADVVMFLHRDSFFSGNKLDNSAELVVRKIRQGDQQNITVRLQWDDYTKRYTESSN